MLVGAAVGSEKDKERCITDVCKSHSGHDHRHVDGEHLFSSDGITDVRTLVWGGWDVDDARVERTIPVKMGSVVGGGDSLHGHAFAGAMPHTKPLSLRPA